MVLPHHLGCIHLGIYPAGWSIFMSAPVLLSVFPGSYRQVIHVWRDNLHKGIKLIISEKPPEIKSEIKWFSVILILVSKNKMTVEVSVCRQEKAYSV